MGTIAAGVVLAFFLSRPPRTKEMAIARQPAPAVASFGTNAVTPAAEPPGKPTNKAPAAPAQFGGAPFTPQPPKPGIDRDEKREFDVKKFAPPAILQQPPQQDELKAQADKEETLKDAAPAIAQAPAPPPAVPPGIGGAAPAPLRQAGQQGGAQSASVAITAPPVGAQEFRSDAAAQSNLVAKAVAPRPGMPAFDYSLTGNSLTIRPLTAGYLTVYAPSETEMRMLFSSARVNAGSSHVIPWPEGFKTINVDLGTGQSFTNGFLAGAGGGGGGRARQQSTGAPNNSNPPTSGRVQASQSSATAHLTLTRE